jgi:hypothetical protein
MDLTAQDAFKLGFLSRCAEERLTGAALDARLEKAAAFNKAASGIGDLVTFSPIQGTNAIAGAVGTGASTLWDAAKAITAVPVAGSILGGAGLGYGAAKMMEPTINDDELKAQELAATYKLYADKAKNRRKSRRYRQGSDAV